MAFPRQGAIRERAKKKITVGTSRRKTPSSGARTGSEQVLQGETYDVYDGEKGSSIALSAVRNEYETANIIVSAEKDLAFTVSVSDLTLADDSSKKIESSNVTVYTQKYMAVNKTWHGGGASVGSYPDALIPQANAVAYKQNYVDAGNNGAAFLEFYVPETAAAGTYTGTATVDLGLETDSVPISLTVYDYTLSPKRTAKRCLRSTNRTSF